MAEKTSKDNGLPDYDIRLLTGPVMKEKPSRQVMLHAICSGGLLNKRDLALKIGELLAYSVYPREEMDRQRPLEIRDDGDRWTIIGSYNRQMKDGRGPLKVVLRKWDAAVLDLATPMLYTAPEDQGKTPDPGETFKRWVESKKP
ncbi:MAG: NTF2 fold immunity protein [Magnetospirillum sp.]|nr:NTF2 fold immunity protein [Magnetospirillum sp.]